VAQRVSANGYGGNCHVIERVVGNQAVSQLGAFVIVKLADLDLGKGTTVDPNVVEFPVKLVLLRWNAVSELEVPRSSGASLPLVT
jgi:hypothetical protein